MAEPYDSLVSAVASAFRAYSTDGNPATPAHHPVKSEIISALTLIAQSIQNVTGFQPGEDVGGAELQDAIEAKVDAGKVFHLAEGTFPVDAIVAYGQLPANDVLLGYASGGGGKTLAIRGAGKWHSIIEGAFEGTILFRFRGGTYPITGRVSIWDTAFHVGTMTTTKPLVSITGNAQIDLQRVLTRGSYDLTRGGGYGQTGQFTGSLIDPEAINSAGPAFNFGAGLTAGTPLGEGNHPAGFWIIRPRARNFVSHGCNGTHSVENGGILDPDLVHDTARFGYPKSNSGLRAGNGNKRLKWKGGTVKGTYRGFQINDPDGADLEGTSFEQIMGPGGVIGSKNNGKAGNVNVKGQRFKNVARGRGFSKPGQDSDDEETDTRSIDQEAANYVITGCENVDISGAEMENDYRPEWYGLLTIVAGETEGTVIDSVNQGSQLGTALSGNFPGDIIYQNDSIEFPTFNFRIARNGISERTYMTATDGTGVEMETVAYGAEPPDRVNATLLTAPIVSITKGNPTQVTVSGSPNFGNGDKMFLHGGDMTEINEQWLEATKIDANNFTLPIDSTDFTDYTTGGTAQRGAGSTVTTVTADAPAMASVTNGVYRCRVLEEKFILTGVCSIAEDESVIETKNITGISKANPGAVTVVDHGYTTGDTIALTDIGGMVELNDRAVTITVVDDDNYTIGVNTSSYTTWTSGGKSHKGVPEGTWARKPLQEPMYFAPGRTGSTITVATNTASVSSTGSPRFLTWIKPFLDDGSQVVLWGSDDATLTGVKVALGRASSVGSNSALTLTANGLRAYTGPFWYSIENKVPFGAIIGDQTAAENRARNVTYDWNMREIGATLATERVYPGTVPYDALPQRRATIPAQSTSSGDGVDVLVMDCLRRKRQRMDDVKLIFSAAHAGHSTNYLKARLIRLRTESGTPTRRIIGSMDVEITQSARAAGDTVTLTAPVHSSGNISADNLFDARQGDKVILNIYAAGGGTGGTCPPLGAIVPQVGW